MAKIVNLRTVKKQAARQAARAVADTNAAKHGLTKAERDRQNAEAAKAARDLDGHKRESD